MLSLRPGICLAGIVGAGLRLWNLRDQVLIGDERWDALAALHYSLGEILSGFVFARSNYSPPLAALYHGLVEAGWRLDEATLRAPAVICGVVGIVALPLLARRFIGDRSTVVLALLLALSPALVWYSRLARVYMPVVLASSAAVLVFLWWYETRSRRWAVAYAALAILSSYLHLLAMPFVLAPFVFAGIDLAWRRAERATWMRTAALGLAVTAGIAIVLAPSFESLQWLLERSESQGRPGVGAVGLASARLAGSYAVVLVVGFYLAAVRGLWLLARDAPRFALLGVILVGAQLVAVVGVATPVGVDEPVLLVRYVLVTLPTLLAWVAVGLAQEWTTTRRARRWIQPAVVAGFLLAVFATGPLATREFRESSFAHAVILREWGSPPPRAPLLEAASFYASLREPDAQGAVIECSWQDVTFQHTAPAYQQVHGARVIVASPRDAWWTDPRVRLRNAVGVSTRELLDSEGRWVVVHPDPVQEEWEARGRDDDYRGVLGVVGDFARNYERSQKMLAESLRRAWGPPDHRDRWIEVWDLDRIRAGEPQR